uniref:Leucine-rich repeat protein 1 n=1 Tax=Cacopsylla melanoneura TaxID=428564 RepID=A0A8D8ZXL5_9HEMI
MKISAKIEVSNRNHACLGSNMKKRAVYSTLSIGKVSRTGDFKILYCTKSMVSPKQYTIKNNVEKVFTKFIKEGKATIRFKCPPEDIIIAHDDGRTLMSFLTILMKVLKNEPVHTTHVLNPQDTKVPSKPKTALVVDSLKEYWFEFPRTLVSLVASNIGLDDIANKVRPLLQLRVLDLSKNIISELPEYLGNLPLSELNVSQNELNYKSNWNWMKRPCIQKTLNKLVLNQNKMIKLPPLLYKFHNLTELYLSGSHLVTVPTWLCTSFTNLRVLDLSGNEMVFLPASFQDLRNIDRLNPPSMSQSDELPFDPDSRAFPSLKSLAAKYVFPERYKLSNKSCPESLIVYLYSCINYCKCGRRSYTLDSPLAGSQLRLEAQGSWFDTFGSPCARVWILYQPCLSRTKQCGDQSV